MWPYAAPMPNTANAITVALQKSPRTQKQRTPTTPYGGVVQGYLKLKRASSGSSNTSCNVVSNKRVSHESPQRTDSHYNDKEPKEKLLNDSATE